MNRREFIKLAATAVLVPSLAGLAKDKPLKLPLKFRYKGFDIVVDELLRRDYIQVYGSNGKQDFAQLYDRDDDLAVIESNTKSFIDSLIKRFRKTA